MENKYGLGSAKVAHEHHEAKLKTSTKTIGCRVCGHDHLIFCPTMNDHRCDGCGEWQADVPQGYSTGHSADY
jgi:hypothetical protein